MWLATVCALLAVGPAQGSVLSVTSTHSSTADDNRLQVTGNAADASSVNFRVRSLSADWDARDVAHHCECWREELRETWCSRGEMSNWLVCCEVVVHPSRGSYLTSVGRGGARTSGSSYIGFDGAKKVNARRIDLLAEGGRGLSAMPHELTHLVLFDLLGKQPPRWADEGVAILADTAAKQKLHKDDLQRALSDQTAFRVADLVALDAYPHPSQIPAFYGQSASVTAFLARRDRPEKFVAFLQRSFDRGYDQSLRDVYGIDGLTELERLWNADREGAISFHGMRLSIDDQALDKTHTSP